MAHLHIGHHFFGAGNLGDDLMLAGFLEALRISGHQPRLTCCIPWDLVAMRLRFPGIEWLPYEDEHRRQCIAQCDAWLGLGDTPFQTSVGDWLLDHLLQEAQLCAAIGKRMFYLCVGVNDAAAASHAKTASLVVQAAHIWTRDQASAAMLRVLVPEARLSEGADLAHIWLSQQRFPEVKAREIGIVLNFEDPAQYTLGALEHLAQSLSERFSTRWLAQEVRPLEGSECALYPQFTEELRKHMPLEVPDYAGAISPAALLAAWGLPGVLLTSRYHASLIGAWMGCRVLVFPRSEKVRSAAMELGLATIADVSNVAAALAALERARAVPRALLADHAALAQRCCDEVLAAISTR